MQKHNGKIRWGDIYYCDLGTTKGSVQSGIRPVVVIQDNHLNNTSPTVTVAVITTVHKKINMPSHIIIGKECGLHEESMIMLEQTRTVDIEKELLEYIGAIKDYDKREEIKRGIKITHGIPVKKKGSKKALILNLCPRCQKKMMENKDIIIKRLNPLHNEKECCDKCSVGYGYEYLIINKEKKFKANGGGAYIRRKD